MNFMKCVTVINWAAIGLLAIVVVGMIFFSNKVGVNAIWRA